MQQTKPSNKVRYTRILLLLVVLQIELLVLTSSGRKRAVLAFHINHHHHNHHQQQQRQHSCPLLNVNNNNNQHDRRSTRCSLFRNKQNVEDIIYNQKQKLSSCSSTRTTSTSNNLYTDMSHHVASISLSVSILLSSSSSILALPTQSYAASELSTTTTSTLLVSDNTNADKSYDGFAEYAKDNQMEQSDVGCFINKCGAQTKELFQNPRGIKGIVCLGQCKGEQVCATRCFAEYGSNSLNNWLSCTIEDNECVKVPKSTIDNSAEDIGYTTTIKKFNPHSLVGTWYKTNGLNPNYDLFDCQTNTFELSKDSTTSSNNNNNNELDMGIFFRVQRPIESGGGYWENSLTEHMVVDSTDTADDSNTNAKVVDQNDMNSAGRTMHTSGKMYGLQFSENWYILGESDGTSSVPEFKLVAYKGHTLQGNYEGAFVYAKTPQLSEAAVSAVTAAATKAGLDFTKFTSINNNCPSGIVLNDTEAGTGTSTNDWIQLLTGEGGVIDWISPGWRGEYNKNIQPQTQTQTKSIASK